MDETKRSENLIKGDLIRKIEDYMNRRNIKQYELARKLNTTESNISNWLKGKHKISRAWEELIRQKLEL